MIRNRMKWSLLGLTLNYLLGASLHPKSIRFSRDSSTSSRSSDVGSVENRGIFSNILPSRTIRRLWFDMRFFYCCHLHKRSQWKPSSTLSSSPGWWLNFLTALTILDGMISYEWLPWCCLPSIPTMSSTWIGSTLMSNGWQEWSFSHVDYNSFRQHCYYELKYNKN